MSIATWYSHQYNAWRRHRHLAEIPLFTPTETRRDMPHSNQDTQSDPSNKDKDKKSTDPLFGPSIGSVSNGPAWTLSSEKKVVTDELTPDIVNQWIEKSKEPSQPTTTLQALVNLKRPTLRLSPLSSINDDPASVNPNDQHQHGLEFEYDCDAPKCGIYVHVHLPKNHPDAPATSSHHPLAKLLVFETVVDGGFGNHLKLEEGALLELGRFEHSTFVLNTKEEPSSSSLSAPSAIAVTPPSEALASLAMEGPAAAAVNDAGGVRGTTGNNRRRFTNFHFRKRSPQNRSISGPALAVVDAAEPSAAAGQDNSNGNSNGNGNNSNKAKDEPEEGVKITIRLAALDEQGTELASPNEQTTYLHIVRFGQRPVELGINEGAGEMEDTRPWVVKVVKREATIGPHTFHLHEIFGLTSSSTSTGATATTTAPLASVPSPPHTYPPEDNHNHNSNSAHHPQAIVPITPADDEDPQSECLLCLSSPREVVLLPCRHLVACKDCALNMVEFGAGGTITQSTEPVGGGSGNGDEGVVGMGGGGGTGTGTGAGGMATGATAVASALATPPPPPAANPRRKRKAKGWFCPVCRQPYTSMLRLTTSAPPLPESKELASAGETGALAGEAGSVTEDEGGGGGNGGNGASILVPPPHAHVHVTAAGGGGGGNGNGGSAAGNGGGGGGGGGGLLSGSLRPGFLRGLSLSRSHQVPDVENQVQVGQARA